MADLMTFPKTFDEFAEMYKIVDKHEVYTNGTELIPIFRVKQWLDHKEDDLHKFAERIKKYYISLNGRTNSNLVAYHVDHVLRELTEGAEK